MIDKMKKIRVAIYARVSSDDQAERNFSIPAQLEACRYFAAGQEWIIVLELYTLDGGIESLEYINKVL